MNCGDKLGYLYRDPLGLIFSLSLLFWGKDFSPFSITRNVLAVVFILESGFHVLGETYLTDDWYETLSSKDRSKDLFWVNISALWSTFFGTKFVILLTECGISKRLVGD